MIRRNSQIVALGGAFWNMRTSAGFTVEKLRRDLGERAVASIWDKNATLWINQVRAGKDVLREFLHNPLFFDAFLPNLAGSDVIDLGCGEGYNTRVLGRRGVQLTGVDLSAEMIAAARAAEEADPLGITYRLGSFTSLEGFPDERFDAAMSTMAFMDSPDFGAAARAAFRVLRPGGRFYFSVLHPCFWTSGSHWAEDPHGNVKGMLVTNYWLDQPYIEIGRFNFVSGTEAPPLSIPRFPYRLGDYVNELANAGFRITGTMEPRPSSDLVNAFPHLFDHIYRHVPILLYFSALKD